jgi:hypothetical protein
VCKFLSFLPEYVLAHPNAPQVYIFVGTIIYHSSWWSGVLCVITAVVGVAYCVLEFIPSIEPPANMREADGGWGAEQV